MGYCILCYTTLFFLVSQVCTVISTQELNFDDEKSEIECENGTKITAFVCLPSGYYKGSSPKKDGYRSVKINASIYINNIREVNVIDRYMIIDITLCMYWTDSRITKKFAKSNTERLGRRSDAGAIVLPIETLDSIWSPDLYIFEMKSFESYQVISSINSLSILYNYYWNPSNYARDYTLNNTVIQYYVDGRVQVYCHDFSFVHFPMEENSCKFLLGTAMYKVNFYFGGGDEWKVNKIQDKIVNGYSVDNVSWINKYPYEYGYDGMGKAVGFEISLKRNAMPYVMQYYVPCAVIVMLTQISFIIPLNAIPGRVALLVTEFLTLTNIFIHQQVNIKSDEYFITFTVALKPLLIL